MWRYPEGSGGNRVTTLPSTAPTRPSWKELFAAGSALDEAVFLVDLASVREVTTESVEGKVST